VTKLTKTIKINAPIEKVFDYMNTPANLPAVWPSMVEVKDVKPLANGGKHFHWKYKMAGMPFEGDSDTVEFVPNQHVVMKNTGIPSTFDWTYRPANGGTELVMTSEYTIPVPVLGKLAEGVVVRLNEQEAEALLANVKTMLEG